MSIERINRDITVLQETLMVVENEIKNLTGHLRVPGEYIDEFHVYELKSIQ